MLEKIKILKKNNGFMRYFKNTSWLLAEKIIRIFVGLFVGVWLVRYLGPEQFGIFSYTQSFTILFFTISGLGLDTIVIRELVKNEEDKNILIGTTFFLKILGTIIFFIFLLIGIKFSQNSQFINILIFIIAFSNIFQIFNVIDFYFQSKVMSKYVVYANFISFLIISILKIFFIVNHFKLISFIFLIVIERIIIMFGLIYFYFKKKESIFLWKFNLKLAKNLLKNSWPLILSGIVITIYMKIDQIMIKEMLSVKEVGKYAVAVTLSETWYFIPVIICNSLFPAIVNAKKVGEKLYYNRLQKLYNLMVWISLSIAISFTFFSKFIINLLYGEKYIEAAGVLTIHIWAGVFVFLGVASGKWLISENLQIYSAINTTIGALTNVILNYILIKNMGIKGAAISTLISYSISGYFAHFLFKKTRENFLKLSKSLFTLGILDSKKGRK